MNVGFFLFMIAGWSQASKAVVQNIQLKIITGYHDIDFQKYDPRKLKTLKN